MPARYFAPIAVIDDVKNHTNVVVWHVDVGHTAAFGAPMPRMSGAGCYSVEELHPDRARYLIAERLIVLAGSAADEQRLQAARLARAEDRRIDILTELEFLKITSPV